MLWPLAPVWLAAKLTPNPKLGIIWHGFLASRNYLKLRTILFCFL